MLNRSNGELGDVQFQHLIIHCQRQWYVRVEIKIQQAYLIYLYMVTWGTGYNL